MKKRALRTDFIHSMGLTFIFFFAFSVNAQNIDRANVLFGFEFTFQDEIIITEPGRSTTETPYKRAKLEEYYRVYSNHYGVYTKTASTNDLIRKPGYFFITPEGNHVVNMEPVTIEVNPPPLHFNQIELFAQPIFDTAEKVGLVPYVNPAGERSGMGHIHVGGKTFAQSPFHLHPLLLRNLLVYTHKHPSLLFGFAEVYDIGSGSNIETNHASRQQVAFQQVISQFDQWWEKAPKNERNKGVFKLLELFIEMESRSFLEFNFFNHFTWINLEHLGNIENINSESKYTVEFRAFRPQKSPSHATANAELILDLLDYLSKPNYLEPFKAFTARQFELFQTSLLIEQDWQEVKEQLNHKNSLSDSQIEELIQVVRDHSFSPTFGINISNSFSKKEVKGQYFEVKIDGRLSTQKPRIEIGNYLVSNFTKIDTQSQNFWVGRFRVRQKKHQDIKSLKKLKINFTPTSPLCAELFRF